MTKQRIRIRTRRGGGFTYTHMQSGARSGYRMFTFIGKPDEVVSTRHEALRRVVAQWQLMMNFGNLVGDMQIDFFLRRSWRKPGRARKGGRA